jgi:hypothetical protein
MTQQHKILLWIIIFFFPILSFGQVESDYEKEEVKVINQFLYKLIDAERLSSFNKSDSSLVIYFQTRLSCNLDKAFKDEYKANKLLRKLENDNLGSRRIDQTKIDSFDKIKIVFENKAEFDLEKYEADNVIGTLTISRISFNKSMTVGYFYYDVYCGMECGWSDLIKIEKKNGKWIIVKYLASWIS